MKQIFEDDPRLTAYALGELEGAELAQVEAAVRGDPTLRSTVDAIRATAQSIEKALAAEAAKTTPESAAHSIGGDLHPKAAIIAENDPVLREIGGLRRRPSGHLGKTLRFPSLYFVIGGLAAACFAVMVALHEPSPQVHQGQGHYTEVSLAELPTTSVPEAPAAVGEKPPEGGTAGTVVDAAASIQFDAHLDKPEAGKLTPPVLRIAGDAPGFTWIGGLVVPN